MSSSNVPTLHVLYLTHGTLESKLFLRTTQNSCKSMGFHLSCEALKPFDSESNQYLPGDHWANKGKKAINALKETLEQKIPFEDKGPVCILMNYNLGFTGKNNNSVAEVKSLLEMKGIPYLIIITGRGGDPKAILEGSSVRNDKETMKKYYIHLEDRKSVDDALKDFLGSFKKKISAESRSELKSEATMNRGSADDIMPNIEIESQDLNVEAKTFKKGLFAAERNVAQSNLLSKQVGKPHKQTRKRKTDPTSSNSSEDTRKRFKKG